MNAIKKKFKSQNFSELPSLTVKERDIRSPTKFKDLRSRMISPVSTRSKNKSYPLPKSRRELETLTHLSPYTINSTEEQSIIHERVRMKVIEAKMSRFSGFKSPRILSKKLIDHINSSNQYEAPNFSEFTDAVHEHNHWEYSRKFKAQKNDLTMLSL